MTYLHWGQEASGSRAAMMCAWEFAGIVWMALQRTLLRGAVDLGR
jgi:hypothetical protein